MIYLHFPHHNVEKTLSQTIGICWIFLYIGHTHICICKICLITITYWFTHFYNICYITNTFKCYMWHMSCVIHIMAIAYILYIIYLTYAYTVKYVCACRDIQKYSVVMLVLFFSKWATCSIKLYQFMLTSLFYCWVTWKVVLIQNYRSEDSVWM